MKDPPAMGSEKTTLEEQLIGINRKYASCGGLDAAEKSSVCSWRREDER